MKPAILTLTELAARVGWPEELVRDWLKKGMLPEPLQREPEPRWCRDRVERWLAGEDQP